MATSTTARLLQNKLRENGQENVPSLEAHDLTLAIFRQLRDVAAREDVNKFATYRDVNILDVMLVPFYLKLLDFIWKQIEPAKSMGNTLRVWAYRAKLAALNGRARMQSETPRAVELLFWPRDAVHLPGQIPIARGYRTVGSCAFVTGNPRLLLSLNRQGERCTFLNTLNKATLRNVAGEVRRRNSIWRQICHAGLLASLPLEQRYASVVANIVAQELPPTIAAVEDAFVVLDRFRPKAMIVGDDRTREGRAACLAAKTQKVLSVVPMHGSVMNRSTQGFHIADIVATYSESQSKILKALGVDESRIKVVGAPYLDGFFDQSASPTPEIEKQLAITPNTPWVLVATSGPGPTVSQQHHQFIVHQLVAAAEALPSLHFVIKLHRKDHPRFYEVIPRHLRDRMHVIRDGKRGFPSSIFSWLRGAEALLTVSSTVALEAMLVDVPVITMDFFGELSRVSFIDAGATRHITSAEELQASLRELIDSSDAMRETQGRAAKFIEKEMGARDGCSTDRLVDLIAGIIHASD